VDWDTAVSPETSIEVLAPAWLEPLPLVARLLLITNTT
jgi:hypothetical protein